MSLCMLMTHRSRRTLESRQNMDDDKIAMLEEELRKAKAMAVDAERNYEEVCFFLS